MNIWISILLSASLLTGCASSPDYEKTPIPTYTLDEMAAILGIKEKTQKEREEEELKEKEKNKDYNQ